MGGLLILQTHVLSTTGFRHTQKVLEGLPTDCGRLFIVPREPIYLKYLCSAYSLWNLVKLLW